MNLRYGRVLEPIQVLFVFIWIIAIIGLIALVSWSKGIQLEKKFNTETNEAIEMYLQDDNE